VLQPVTIATFPARLNFSKIIVLSPRSLKAV